MAAEAEADVADLYGEGGALKPVKEWPLIWRQGLVAGLDINEKFEDGEKTGQVTKIRLSDRIKRIELIGRHVNVQAFVDRKEITGKGGAPLIEEMSDHEVARQLAFLFAKAAHEAPADDESE